jgi:outer membrane protein OmpA-like peptidoglycan-associated protein
LYYSKQRALNVFNIIAKKIDKKRIVVSWYGESEPIASNTTKEGMQHNRRVSIVLR